MRKILLSVLLAFTLFTSYKTPPDSLEPIGIRISEVLKTLDPHTLKVHFIDVGAGLAAFVQTPTGKTILIDGGKKYPEKLEAYLLNFLPAGSTIDLVIVTHADYDHFKGQMELFLNGTYNYSEFWYNGFESDELAGLSNWPRYLDTLRGYAAVNPGFRFLYTLGDHYEEGDRVVIDEYNKYISYDDVSLVLMNLESSPAATDPNSSRTFKESERRNNASIVFKLEYGDVSFLFTGDVNGKRLETLDDEECDSEEFELLSGHLDNIYSLTSTVFQSPHHGSNGSNSLPFMQAVAPEYILIAAGGEHGHPTQAVYDRMIQVVPEKNIFRTDLGEQWGDDIDFTDEEYDDNYIFECSRSTVEKIYRIH